jgi:hypothetical protein
MLSFVTLAPGLALYLHSVLMYRSQVAQFELGSLCLRALNSKFQLCCSVIVHARGEFADLSAPQLPSLPDALQWVARDADYHVDFLPSLDHAPLSRLLFDNLTRIVLESQAR